MCLFFQTCVTQIMLPVIMSDDDSLVEHDRQAIMRKIWKEDIDFRPRYTLSCIETECTSREAMPTARAGMRTRPVQPPLADAAR
jgi:hypothetical protein